MIEASSRSSQFTSMLLGVGVSLDEIAGDELYTMMPIEEERDRLEREQMRSARH
jgi:hypothetical protein